MTYSIEYYNMRVREEIESWPADLLADYARLIELLIEFGPQLRMPRSRAFGDGLFELRPKSRSGIGRPFYCFLVGQKVIILHSFRKKTQDTPDHELKIARKRLKEIRNA